MKLLTHKLLSSHVRVVGPRGSPPPSMATEVGMNSDIVVPMIPKREWAVLLKAAYTTSQLQLHLVEVPKESMESYENHQTFLRKVNHMLLEVDVLEGTLQCSQTGRLFPIGREIPNMLLNDKETEN